MCGISAVLDGRGSGDTVAALLRMHDPIQHRGPDGEGFLLVDGRGRCRRWSTRAEVPTTGSASIGLAFRRLKVMDLTEAAAQPIGSVDGSLWMVFNGEIYNFRALRAELAALGHVFRSTGDAEVLLAAFAAWGERCFERLEGMWALVIVDLARRRLVVSRDRFGIKPLYWAIEDGRLLLGSEIKQILRGRRAPAEAHAPLVGMYLKGERIPCLEETFFAGIRAVPPGSWFHMSLDTEPTVPTFVSYWDLSAFHCLDPDRPGRTYRAAVGEFRSILTDAVASHDSADVAVGSLLSGGLDTSTIATLLNARLRSQDRPCPTFSFGFREAAPQFCELKYVDALVARHHLVNHETTFDSAWVGEHTPRVVRALEEPPMALPAVAQYRVFELCRQHGVTVVLDGTGSDEILAGYGQYQRMLLLDRLRRCRLREFLRETRAIEAHQGRRAFSLLAHGTRSVLRARRLVRRAAERKANGWLVGEYGRRTDVQEIVDADRDVGRDPSPVNRQLYRDVRWGNVKIVLGYSDKSAMAHSVEARVPFFDRKLVEFAFSLPDHYKVGAGIKKRILRDVAREFVPSEITERRDKMGFAVPHVDIIRGAMWESVRERILEGGFLTLPCLDATATRRLVEDFEASRHQDARAIWRLYALALWRDEFHVTIL